MRDHISGIHKFKLIKKNNPEMSSKNIVECESVEYSIHRKQHFHLIICSDESFK